MQSTITTPTVAATVPRFVQSVYDILQNEDQRIISWSADGSCFQVHDVARLEREILPKYYKHCRFSSFQRQLNNFGFQKWTKTRAKVATFSHEYLHRCDPPQLATLVAKMERAKTSFRTRSGTKRKSDAGLQEEQPKRPKTMLIERIKQQGGSGIRDAEPVRSSFQLGESDEDDALLFQALSALDLFALDWNSAPSLARVGEADADVSTVLLTDEDVSTMLNNLDDDDVLLECEVDDLFGTIADLSGGHLFFV